MNNNNNNNSETTNNDINEANIQKWKVKKLINGLENAKGNGTSMISLIIPPTDKIPRIQNLLTIEYGASSNIKSRVNRQAVQTAIVSCQQKLKLYNKIPANGLILYCGNVVTDENNEKLLKIDLEPFKPIGSFLYLCDSKFHVEPLKQLLNDDATYGVMVIDGEVALFGTIVGNNKNILCKIAVDLPKKHNKGGQSSVRFARLRTEARHNYSKKIAELCTQCFITNDMPNVVGLLIGGSNAVKTELINSQLMDKRLIPKIIGMFDTQYGGENGFNETIELAGDILKGVKLSDEKKLLSKYFDEIANDGKFCYGVKDTMYALEAGAINKLIIWEDVIL